MIQKRNFGEIWLANLNPPSGTEPGKTRPVLIVQNQVLLEVNHPSTLIVPLTTNLIQNAEPLRLRISPRGDLKQFSDLLIDQLRAIDNKRLVKGPLAQCDLTFMKRVHQAILDVIGCDIQDLRQED